VKFVIEETTNWGEEMVKIKSPVQIKDLEVNVGTKMKGLFGIGASKVDIFDNDRMVILNLKKGESVAVFDKDNNVWELSRNTNGRLNKRKL
jgi:hypothetical protein